MFVSLLVRGVTLTVTFIRAQSSARVERVRPTSSSRKQLPNGDDCGLTLSWGLHGKTQSAQTFLPCRQSLKLHLAHGLKMPSVRATYYSWVRCRTLLNKEQKWNSFGEWIYISRCFYNIWWSVSLRQPNCVIAQKRCTFQVTFGKGHCAMRNRISDYAVHTLHSFPWYIYIVSNLGTHFRIRLAILSCNVICTKCDCSLWMKPWEGHSLSDSLSEGAVKPEWHFCNRTEQDIGT
jgi:hypothetical protein